MTTECKLVIIPSFIIIIKFVFVFAKCGEYLVWSNILNKTSDRPESRISRPISSLKKNFCLYWFVYYMIIYLFLAAISNQLPPQVFLVKYMLCSKMDYVAPIGVEWLASNIFYPCNSQNLSFVVSIGVELIFINILYFRNLYT